MKNDKLVLMITVAFIISPDTDATRHCSCVSASTANGKALL